MKKSRPKFNRDRKDPKVSYVCDGRGCDKMCKDTMSVEEWGKYPCHHTTEEEHAFVKCRRDRKFKCDRDPKTGAVVGYTEIER